MSIDGQLAAKLKDRLEHEINMAKERVAGGACGDFSEYRFSLGMIKAMTYTIGWMADIQEEIIKGDQK